MILQFGDECGMTLSPVLLAPLSLGQVVVLAIEVFSLAMAIIGLRRWSEARHVVVVGSFAAKLRLFTWPLWISVSVVCWAVVCAAAALALGFQTDAATAESESAIEGRVEFLVATLGAVVAVVTGFFLVVLHRTADEGRRIIDDLKSFSDKLAELREGEQRLANDLRYLEEDGVRLREAVLMPMAYRVGLGADRVNSAPEWQDILTTQSMAFRLLLADDVKSFQRFWVELKVSTAEAFANVGYFAERAEKHLESLVQAHPWQLGEAELRELRYELRAWGKDQRRSDRH